MSSNFSIFAYSAHTRDQLLIFCECNFESNKHSLHLHWIPFSSHLIRPEEPDFCTPVAGQNVSISMSFTRKLLGEVLLMICIDLIYDIRVRWQLTCNWGTYSTQRTILFVTRLFAKPKQLFYCYLHWYDKYIRPLKVSLTLPFIIITSISFLYSKDLLQALMPASCHQELLIWCKNLFAAISLDILGPG